jgi:hypothetical protein
VRLGPQVATALRSLVGDTSFYSNSSEGGDEIRGKRNIVKSVLLSGHTRENSQVKAENLQLVPFGWCRLTLAERHNRDSP